MANTLSHFDHNGNAIMVDVSEKQVTSRSALATGKITMNKETFEAIRSGTAKKGDVLGVARVAGIMAVKRTSDLIPMCHPLQITKCKVDFELIEEECSVKVSCTTKVNGQTGVEMEALTGASVSLLTIYDMCKAMDKAMVISDIKLMEKQGGKSGHYLRQEE